MPASLLKRSLPHLIAVAVFLLVALLYCKPALEGKVLLQSDVLGYKAMAQQSVEFKEKHGHYPLWTESMFSGMPGYNIAMSSTSDITIGYLNYLFTLGLPKPVNFFFLACICFYILTQVLRLNPWVGVLSALAYAYSTFDPIIIAVGHETQMMAIGYAPAVIGGLLLIFQRKYLAGAALFALFFGLETGTQHLQILYYTSLILGFITLAYLYNSWRQKQIKPAILAVGIAIGAGIVGLCAYALALLPTREYAAETMRGGKSELTNGNNQNKTKGGLDKDYAFHWSYGIAETFTLFVPAVYGGGSQGKEFTDNSKFADKLEEKNVPEANALQLANSNAYWGTQPGTAGPVYLGAVICFLFILGIVYVKSWHKWWILAVTVLGIAMAWGKNFSGFNYFLFDHLPFYSKFRSPTMALVIPQFTFPLLGALGLNQLLGLDKTARAVNWKAFKTVLLISGCLLAVLVMFYFSTDFKGPNDATLKENFSNSIVQQMARGKQPTPEMQQQANEEGNSLLKSLKEDRQSLFGSDLLRALVFVGLAALLMGLYLKNKIQSVILLIGLCLLSSYDLLAEGKIYLNDDNFVDPADIESSFTPTQADQKISSDPDKNFRVFDESDQQNGPFNSSRASYFHHSIGGYHPAKLGLYQDIIENQLQKGNMMVFNMLNTRYFIQNNPSTRQPQAMLNPAAFGPCWLVKSIHYVKDANEEMKALDSINVRDTAIVQQLYERVIKFPPVPDSLASISLIENLNDQITYQFSSKTNQFAVFSEVFYDKGWDALLDGNKTDYCKVDYILRGMPVPAGEHKIEFRFEPRSYSTGNSISVLSSIISYLLLIASGVEIWRKKKTVSLKIHGNYPQYCLLSLSTCPGWRSKRDCLIQ
jgi:hypothetical protein